LREQVLARRSVVVGRQGNRVRAAYRAAGEDVLVEFVIIAVERAVAQRKPFTEVMLHSKAGEIDVGLGKALVGITKERAGEALERLAAVRWEAAVGGAAVVEIFVGQVNARIRADLDRGGRVDPVALQLDVVAKAVTVLEHAVDTKADAVSQRLVEIGGEALVAEAVA